VVTLKATIQTQIIITIRALVGWFLPLTLLSHHHTQSFRFRLLPMAGVLTVEWYCYSVVGHLYTGQSLQVCIFWRVLGWGRKGQFFCLLPETSILPVNYAWCNWVVSLIILTHSFQNKHQSVKLSLWQMNACVIPVPVQSGVRTPDRQTFETDS
jgi:hypothetical protein